MRFKLFQVKLPFSPSQFGFDDDDDDNDDDNDDVKTRTRRNLSENFNFVFDISKFFDQARIWWLLFGLKPSVACITNTNVEDPFSIEPHDNTNLP